MPRYERRHGFARLSSVEFCSTPTAALFLMGDSRTAAGDWQASLLASLTAANCGGCITNWSEATPRGGVAGHTVALQLTWIGTNLSGVTPEPRYILSNLGAVDSLALPAEAT